MYLREVKKTFRMTNGRVLSCEYTEITVLGNLGGAWEDSYPDEVECGDPIYKIDGVKVAYENLPKGLDEIADSLYGGTF